MSTAFPHCWMECKARAGWLNVPSVPGAAGRTLCHYGQSAPADPRDDQPKQAEARNTADQIGWRPTWKHLFCPARRCSVSLRSMRRSRGQNPCVLRRGFSHLSFRDVSRREAMTRLSPPIPCLRPP
jgi:hypothetical protein